MMTGFERVVHALADFLHPVRGIDTQERRDRHAFAVSILRLVLGMALALLALIVIAAILKSAK